MSHSRLLIGGNNLKAIKCEPIRQEEDLKMLIDRSYRCKLAFIFVCGEALLNFRLRFKILSDTPELSTDSSSGYLIPSRQYDLDIPDKVPISKWGL